MNIKTLREKKGILSVGMWEKFLELLIKLLIMIEIWCTKFTEMYRGLNLLMELFSRHYMIGSSMKSISNDFIKINHKEIPS